MKWIFEMSEEDVKLLKEGTAPEGILAKVMKGRPVRRKGIIAYFKRPKCKNNYRCSDCIHSDQHWEELTFRGFSCRINAR